MPRPLWAGAISFGLVSIPVKVLSATQDRSIRFRQVHLADGGRVRTAKVCELDGHALSQDEIGKGFERPGGDTVPVTDEELDQLPLPTAKAIEIVAFVDADSIDQLRISGSYYLAADGLVAAKPYTLLRRALERSDKAAIAKFAWHNRERLGLLRVREDAIVLHAMRWPDEIRSPQSLAPRTVELDEGEIDQALQLADAMALDSITGFRDTYRDALEELLTAKSEGRKAPEPAQGEEREQGQVVDLMAALNASVAAAKESRGEDRGGDGGEATVHEMRPSKKAAAKKTASGKQTTVPKGSKRTSPAKKTAAASKGTARKRSAS
ncbi:Ku protein [Streptomyces sp. CFMR 7]|uniref:non-homologous end joining protein Ku n=1 Tax=Streptomyces sp. CFMR 7 TaxID=1649184 RepID=UPI0011A30893|nr:Ku protein [Streptomyces sp. CFMR 7]